MTERPFGWRDNLGPMVALLGGVSTLVCCALPALFVSLGLGAALAGLVTAIPQIGAISAHKPELFGGTAVVIAAATALQWRSRNMPCPADPRQAQACRRLRTFSWGVLWAAGVTWAVGFFFAFLAVDLIC